MNSINTYLGKITLCADGIVRHLNKITENSLVYGLVADVSDDDTVVSVACSASRTDGDVKFLHGKIITANDLRAIYKISSK